MCVRARAARLEKKNAFTTRHGLTWGIGRIDTPHEVIFKDSDTAQEQRMLSRAAVVSNASTSSAELKTGILRCRQRIVPCGMLIAVTATVA